ARTQNATQIVLGASHRSRLAELMRGSVINAVIRDSGTIDVHVISAEESNPGPPAPFVRALRSASQVAPRRRFAAWVLVAAPSAVITVVLANLRSTLTRPTDLLLYLLLVVAVAAIGGFAAAA